MRSHKDKGRVVRGLCCSGGGVFKPDERETRESLADRPCSVNAETAGRSEAYLLQLLLFDVSYTILAVTEAYSIEPRDRDRCDQVALSPRRRGPRWYGRPA